MKSIHNDIIQILRQKTPEQDNTVDFLLNILPMSKEAAYRRLRGEIPFTLNEAIKICEKLNISLDQLIDIKNNDTYTFHLSSMFSAHSLDNFYQMVNEMIGAIEHINRDPHCFAYGAEYTLPFTFTSKYFMLSKIKLFKWASQAHIESAPITLEDFKEEEKYMLKLKEYSNKALRVKTSLILNKHIFSIFVKDMIFLNELGIINDEEIKDIKKELYALLDDLEIASVIGQFEHGGKARIYVSETFFDNSYIYIQGNNYKACAMKIYGINHLSCENPVICDIQKNWIESMMRYSSLISESGELQRTKYFKTQREVVDRL